MNLMTKLTMTLLVAGAAGHAATLRLTSIGPGYTNVPMIVFGATGNQYAVALNALIDGSPYVAFCVDIQTPISLNQNYNSTFGAPSSYTNGQRAAWIYVNYIDSISTGNAATNTFNASAIQLALWDVIHDGGDGFSSGNVQVNAGSNTTWQNLALAAASIVTASAGQISNNATILYNVSLNNGTPAQTLITRAMPSPEPSSMVFMGAGAAFLAIGSWKRRQPRRQD